MANDKPQIALSVASFHELAQKLELLGIKVSDAKTLIIEKGTDLKPPIDWRLVTVRKDCAELITKLMEWHPDNTDIIMAIDELYNYIVFHKMPELEELPNNVLTLTKKDEWR